MSPIKIKSGLFDGYTEITPDEPQWKSEPVDVTELRKALAAERAAHAETRERLSREANAADRAASAAEAERDALCARAAKVERTLSGLADIRDDLREVCGERDAFRAALAQAVEALDDPDFLYGCDTVDLQEDPPCGDCRSCRQRKAITTARKLLNPEGAEPLPRAGCLDCGGEFESVNALRSHSCPMATPDAPTAKEEP